MSDQTITLTVPLLNGVMQYLGTRPYSEVFQLVQAIQEQAAPQVKAAAPQVESAGGTD